MHGRDSTDWWSSLLTRDAIANFVHIGNVPLRLTVQLANKISHGGVSGSEDSSSTRKIATGQCDAERGGRIVATTLFHKPHARKVNIQLILWLS